MKKNKIKTILTASVITASTVASIATPVFAKDYIAPTRTLVFSDYLCNKTEDGIEHNEDDYFELAFESVNRHTTIQDYLKSHEVDPETIEIKFNGWKENATDKNCNPIKVKEWTLTSNIGEFKIYDKEDPIAKEEYELDYTEDSAELRQITAKINYLTRQSKSYYNADGTAYVNGAAYTKEEKVENGVKTITIYKNGKYFWTREPNPSLIGLNVFEKDPVLEVKINMDADETGIENFVHNIYRIALNRTPDQAGYEFWTNSLRSQDWAGRQVLNNLLDTPEFKELNLTAEEFVERMYNVINGRESDSEGFAYWVNRYNEVLQYKIDNCTLHENCGASQDANKHIGDARLEILNYMMNESEFKGRCESMGIRF